jgi:hypothetical protein
MSIEPNHIVGAIAIGIGATLLMDLWNLFRKRAFNVPSLNYCLLGRWLRHMPEGTFRHTSITAAPQKRFECTVGWIAHYTIGVAFALLFVVLTSGAWLARPTLLIALLYGIGTVVFPFFVMQPSLGLGIAASRTPKPMQARLKSLVTHTVFGVGLYLSALGVSNVLRVHAAGEPRDSLARQDSAAQVDAQQDTDTTCFASRIGLPCDPR